MSPPPAPTVPDEAVVVSVPADPAYFRVLRLTAAVVAGELLNVEAVEDAQIGVEQDRGHLLVFERAAQCPALQRDRPGS